MSGIDGEKLLSECEVTFIKAGGPGGQHRNTRETGVRLDHLPSGIRVEATERRSQARNMDVALERLAEKIAESKKRRKPRVKTRPGKNQKLKRLEKKRKQSQKKSLRKPPSHTE